MIAGSAPRKFKFRKRAEDACTYSIEVRDWSIYYSFGDNDVEGPLRFSEIAILSIEGVLTKPEIKNVSTCKVRFFLRSFDIDMGRRPDQPSDIGEIYKSDGELEATLSAHVDGTNLIVPALASGKVGSLLLFGHKLRYGNARIDSFVVETKRPAEPDD